MADVSDELWELASEALDLFIDCFAVGESNAIVVFDDGSGQRHMVDVKDAQGNVTPELLEAAQGVVSESVGTAAQRYAIAFDGYLTTDGERRLTWRRSLELTTERRSSPDSTNLARHQRCLTVNSGQKRNCLIFTRSLA